MSTIDIQYIMQVSPRLEGTSKRNLKTYITFVVPTAVIPKRNVVRHESYFYRVKNDMFFKCHNCGEGKTVGTFLKDIDNDLYKRYTIDRYKGLLHPT